LANAPGFDRQPWRNNQEGDQARDTTIDLHRRSGERGRRRGRLARQVNPIFSISNVLLCFSDVLARSAVSFGFYLFA
jgi:hypothetical protein